MAKRLTPNATAATLGFEAKLWQGADALRNTPGPAKDRDGSRNSDSMLRRFPPFDGEDRK